LATHYVGVGIVELLADSAQYLGKLLPKALPGMKWDGLVKNTGRLKGQLKVEDELALAELVRTAVDTRRIHFALCTMFMLLSVQTMH